MTAPVATPRAARSGWRRLLRVLFVVAAAGSCIAAIVAERGQLRAAVAQLDLGPVLLAAVLAIAGTVASMLCWRALLTELGSTLPVRAAARMFFLSQLGKYLPGSVWPVIAQAELGRDHQIPARRSAAAAMLTLVISLVVGLVVAAATLPFAAPDAIGRYGWALAAAPLLAVLLHPRVLQPLLGAAFRLARRQPPEAPLRLAGIGRAAFWALAAWICYGLHAVVLVVALGGSGAAALVGAVGAFSLAWSVGFLVLVVPAGAGVREAVLVLALSPTLPAGAALLLALVSRALMTLADLVVAGLAVLVERRRTAGRPLALEAPTR
jgi:uncharacterized membrane protein YbhN (UPF0104 family)